MTGAPFTYWLLSFVGILCALAICAVTGNALGKLANFVLGDKDARPFVARRGGRWS
jgi:membrane protein YqaA with SNARE-associated domain